MTNLFRKLRGVLSIGAFWGVPGAVVGAIGGAVASVLGGAPLLGSILLGSGMVGGLFFAIGSGFAGALALTERHRTLGTLTPKRAALWGGWAGALVPVAALLASMGLAVVPLIGDPDVLLALLAGMASTGGLGAVVAGGTVAAAKHTPDALEAGPSGEAPAIEPGPSR